MSLYRRISTAIIIGCGLFRSFAQADKAEIDAHLQKARDALAHHDLAAADQQYAEILKLQPGNVDVNAARGMTLYALGKPAEATAPLRAALAADPSRSEAETFLALSLADLGKCRDASPLLKKHFNLQLDPKLRRVVGLSLLGCSAFANPGDALDVARQLKSSYPDDPDVLYQVAELYSALSKAAVNDLLKRHPESFRVHQLAGEALEAQNNDAQALIEYRKALEVNPKAPHLHYRIAAILLRDKKNATEQQALLEFNEELRVNPGDAASEYQIAEIFRQQNKLDDASLHFAKAAALNPAFTEAQIGLAKIAMAQHNVDAALRHLQTAVRLSPDDAGAHYSLMLAYRQAGKMEDAAREMATVEALNAKQRSDLDANLHTLLTGHRDQ